MRPFLDSCVRFVRSWIGITALIAVATLAVIAFDRREAQEIQTIRSQMHVLCQQINMAGTEIARNSLDTERNRMALTRALKVAAGEAGQNTKDRLEYARLRGILDSSMVEHPSIALDCEGLVK